MIRPLRLFLALSLVLLLFPRPAGPLLLHPLAPPLTHIPSASLSTLDPSQMPAPRDGLRRPVEQIVQQIGTDTQRQAIQVFANTDAQNEQRRRDARRFRLLLEEDALAMAALLGPERVETMLKEKPALSEAVGEIKVWKEAIAP